MELSEHKTIRCKEFDYSTAGMYFFTVVTERRNCLFGNINDSKIRLSPLGETVRTIMNEIPLKFKGVEILNAVIMPNHVHLLIFNKEGISVIEVMRWFKAKTAQEYRKERLVKGIETEGIRLWQRSCHDVVIRNERMLNYIDNYINANPLRWKYAKMNGQSLEDKDEIMKEINSLH